MTTETISVPVAKTGKTYPVPFSTFTPEVQAAIIAAGMGRIFGDMGGGKSLTPSDHDKAIEAKIASWASGVVRQSFGRTSDPVAREARSIATALVTAKVKAKGQKPADVKNFADLVSTVAARPDVLAQAKANVAAIGDLDIDI